MIAPNSFARGRLTRLGFAPTGGWVSHNALYYRHLAEECLRLASKLPDGERAALMARAARYHELASEAEQAEAPERSKSSSVAAS